MPNRPSDPKRKSGSRAEPARGARGWLKTYWPALLGVLVVTIAAGIWWSPSDVGAVADEKTRGGSQFMLGPGSPDSAPPIALSPQARAQRLAELKGHLELTERTLCSYRAGTKYPQESRPIAEHPDQIYPNQPVVELHAMRTSDKTTDASVQIKSSQSRVYLASGEAVVFSLAATDTGGKALPLFVTQAVARGIIPTGGRTGPQIVLPFADEGNNGDAAANDGTVSGLLVPAATGFANFNGTIRVEVKYNVGDRSGFLLFDVIYSSEIPATWGNAIREAVEDGSLNLYLKADIRQAGRYVVSGRVDDAKGKPFALVSFNDVLPTGPDEIRLTIFGKLLRDQAPVFPLTLRDVDAYLLKENADPDRALMSRLVGKSFVTKMHTPGNFSEAEWQGEQRTRYLTELGKDVGLAKDALSQFDPTQSNDPFRDADCQKLGLPN